MWILSMLVEIIETITCTLGGRVAGNHLRLWYFDGSWLIPSSKIVIPPCKIS